METETINLILTNNLILKICSILCAATVISIYIIFQFKHCTKKMELKHKEEMEKLRSTNADALEYVVINELKDFVAQCKEDIAAENAKDPKDAKDPEHVLDNHLKDREEKHKNKTNN
ncbi:MAG TPA: hypothetical protein GXZ87_08510 [Bacteroidales bacterium]|nr:hypothetical protein [Bacteroidales bacterium]